jgi:hypothetical protein
MPYKGEDKSNEIRAYYGKNPGARGYLPPSNDEKIGRWLTSIKSGKGGMINEREAAALRENGFENFLVQRNGSSGVWTGILIWMFIALEQRRRPLLLKRLIPYLRRRERKLRELRHRKMQELIGRLIRVSRRPIEKFFGASTPRPVSSIRYPGHPGHPGRNSSAAYVGFMRGGHGPGIIGVEFALSWSGMPAG